MKRRRPAFTLFELILVMLILIIIASMTVPSLSGFGRGRKVDDAATELLAITQWARAKSINDGLVYRLNFEASTRTYFLTCGDGFTFGPVGEESGRRFELPDNVEFQWNPPERPDGQYVEFLPSGRTDAVQIQLRDQRGQVTTIASESPTEIFRILPTAVQ